jgi:hypothetical protein
MPIFLTRYCRVAEIGTEIHFNRWLQNINVTLLGVNTIRTKCFVLHASLEPYFLGELGGALHKTPIEIRILLDTHMLSNFLGGTGTCQVLLLSQCKISSCDSM